MLIYGVDLGTRRIAIACPAVAMVWSTTTEGSRDMRLYPTELDAGFELGRRARKFLADWYYAEHRLQFWGGELEVGACFVAERPFVGRPHGNVRTAIGQALSGAGAMAALPGRRVMIEQAQWKKELCGDGSASKDDIRAWVECHQPALAEACGEDENRFDAVGIALGSALLAQAGDL